MFPELTNDLILRAAKGEAVERTPVWIMRQAGRYLPENAKQHDFFSVCRSPELASKVTLQPIDRYQGLLDASIIFCDILVIPQALGLEVEMLPAKGPHFPDPIRTIDDLKRIKETPNIKVDLKYVYDAITMTRQKLAGRVPLFGFAGAPWTLMAYMIEGGGSKTLSLAKGFLYRHPEESHWLLQRVTDAVVEFLVEQVKAGAQLLQVFDSWAGELSPEMFTKFSLPYLTQIAEKVKSNLTTLNLQQVPLFVFAKGAHFAIKQLSNTQFDVVSLDWTMDPASVSKDCGNLVLQGNADPILLYASKEVIKAETRRMLESFERTGKGHIANLGHGMLPDHDPENLRAYLEAVRDVSVELKKKSTNGHTEKNLKL